MKRSWFAVVGEQDVNMAWGQQIILIDALDMVVVTTADPFFMQHDNESWKNEKETIDLVGKFISALPGE